MGDVNLSVLDRTINFFIFLSACCSVAPIDLPHFTLGSSKMPFKHIHYKLAGFFFSFNRRFLMNPYCWYYNGVDWYCLVTLVVLLFNICRGFVDSRAILSFFVTEFDQTHDSYVYIVMRCGYSIVKFFSFHHFVPDADVSNYVMFFSVTM